MPLAAVRATLQVFLNRLPLESVEPPVEQVVQSQCEVAAFHFDGLSYPLTRWPAEKGSIGSSVRKRSRCPLRSASSSGPSLVAGKASRGLSSPSASVTSSTTGERARWRTESTY